MKKLIRLFLIISTVVTFFMFFGTKEVRAVCSFGNNTWSVSEKAHVCQWHNDGRGGWYTCESTGTNWACNMGGRCNTGNGNDSVCRWTKQDALCGYNVGVFSCSGASCFSECTGLPTSCFPTYGNSFGSCWVAGGPTPTPTPPPGPTPTPMPIPTCSGTSSAPACGPIGGNWVVTASGVQNATTVTVNGYDDRGWAVIMKTYTATNMGGGTWQATIPQTDLGGYQGHMIGDVFMSNASHANVFCSPQQKVPVCPTCTIQGYKQPNQPPFNSQTVTLNDPLTQTATNPYFLGFPYANKTRTVSVTKPAGYDVGYTLCYNSINCHAGVTPTPAPSASVSIPDNAYCQLANGYADLWWHYTVQAGTIQARAVSVDPTNTTCATIRAGGTGGIDGSKFLFSAGSPSHPTPTPLQQAGSTYVWFNNAASGGPYTIYATPSPAPAYVPARYCWQLTQGVNPPTTGETQSANLTSGETLTWDIGFTRPGPWSQAAGGDVYASGTLQSFVPVGASPRAFILDGAGTTSPGVATYGTNYDFDDAAGQGETWVSSKNWLVHEPGLTATDYYQLMFQQFGGEPAVWDYDHPVSPITKPASRSTPYYVKGDMTTSGSWSVGAGQTIIFIVDGALTINGTVTVAPGGFAAFIVNGNITILSSVATIQGIYITSPAGTFATGASATQFFGTGTFVAGNFSLQRNVDTLNPTTSSEVFTYNPQLLITMPEAMKKLSVSWQEVAP